ncbi:MAG: hypothetical protein ACRECR_03390, partial [Thermoplasmata archaeon]
DGSCAEYFGPPYSVCLDWVPAVVVNVSTAAGTLAYAPGGNYSFTFADSQLTSIDFLGGALPTGAYALQASVTAINSSNPSFSGRTVYAEATSYLAWNAPLASFLSPANNSSELAVGQSTTVVIAYSGDYITGAVFNVTNATSGQLVDSQGIFESGPGGHGTFARWTPGTPGRYLLSVTLFTSYLAPYTVSEGVTVGPAGSNGGGTTYINTTYWHNATGFPGLGPAATSALLLVLGLVAGMALALLLGRDLFRKDPPAPPATGRGRSTCSVCGQSFDSEPTLATHAKDSHGIGPADPPPAPR